MTIMGETTLKRVETSLGKSALGSPTRQLAEFASGLRYQDLPSAVVEHAKLCVLDNLGVSLFGSTLPWTRLLTEMVHAEKAAPRATIWGQGLRTSASAAALVNSTAGHGFELDDLHLTALFHPGSVTVAPALAMAEHLGGRDGREFLTAVVAGYEVGVRVGMACGQAHFFRGFHPQGTFGAFAAAAAAGRMLRLSADQMVHSLGIAGSQAAGLMAAQEGAMVKRLHAGRAAQSGVYAALLASRGFTGIVDVLEAKFGGFCTATTGEYQAEALTAGLGQQFEILRVGFKPYPTGGSTHTTIDALLQLRAEHPFSPDEVDAVEVRTTRLTAVHYGWNYEPRGVTSAQMNLAFVVAALLVDGDVTVDRFTEDGIRDPKILAVVPRVRVQADESLDALGPELRHAVVVDVRLRNGTTLTRRVLHRKGSPENPMTRQEVVSKFRDLAARALRRPAVEAIEARIFQLEEEADVTSVARLLIGRRAGA